MKLKGKKILVTGAGGFIGSHLVESLIASGACVKALVFYNRDNDWGNLEALSSEIKSNIEVILGDIRDPDFCMKIVKDIDIIFHLAALIGIPYSYLSPRSYIDTNVSGTMNVCQAALENNCEKIVHTSTSEVYGSAQYMPIDEAHPLQPQSPYSASKIGADSIALSYYYSFNLPLTIVRPFNVFGPRQSLRAVIPTIIGQALSQGEVKLGSLFPKRDYTFVKDTVQAFIKAAENKESIGKVFNIGTNREVSIGEIAEKIITLLGKEIEIYEDEKRVRPEKSEVNRLLCNNKLALDILNWEAKFSFEVGLEQTIDWMRNNLAQIKAGGYII